MSEASGASDLEEPTQYDDDELGFEEWNERSEDSGDYDDLDDEESDDEEEEADPTPRDLEAVPCCSREVDDRWMRPRGEEVPRCVVIDGANLVHTGSAYSCLKKDPMLDIASLLAWIRFFLVNDFEVITVLPQRYLRPTFVLHTDILKSLNRCGLLFVPNSLEISDDYIVLDLAKQCAGLVLSVDQYRDHCRTHPEVEATARHARVSPVFRDEKQTLGEDEWFRRTRDGRHWLAYHTLAFAERAEMDEQQWRAKFFSTPASSGMRHELAVEQRERWSEEWKRRRMELVDGAIRARAQRPPAYKEVISRRDHAAQLKEEKEQEEERLHQFEQRWREKREVRQAERQRAKELDTVD